MAQAKRQQDKKTQKAPQTPAGQPGIKRFNKLASDSFSFWKSKLRVESMTAVGQSKLFATSYGWAYSLVEAIPQRVEERHQSEEEDVEA